MITNWLSNRANELRANRTDAEVCLSKFMRKWLPSTYFEEQCPMHGYIPDFYVPGAKLVIELDGSFHLRNGGKEHDEKRDKHFAEKGIKTLRMDNQLLVNNPIMAKNRIIDAIESQTGERPETQSAKKKLERRKSKTIMSEAYEHLNIK